MSWQATAFVQKLARRTTAKDLSPTEVAVLVFIGAAHYEKDGCTYGHIDDLAAETHLSPTHLSRVINGLEDRGYLSVWDGRDPPSRDVTDGRSLRLSAWCLVGFDSDDGPIPAGWTRRVRLGGRPPDRLRDAQPISNQETPDRLRVAQRKVAPRATDRGNRLRDAQLRARDIQSPRTVGVNENGTENGVVINAPDNPWGPLSDSFKQAMVRKYGPLLGGEAEVLERIEDAENFYRAPKHRGNYVDIERCVRGSLRRDVERVSGGRNGFHRNGNSHIPAPDYLVAASREDLEALPF
jgi:hypothetical protein